MPAHGDIFRDQASLLEARFEAGPPASISTPVLLFPDRFDRPQVGTHTGYDALPDGRFLMSETTELPAGARVFDPQIVFVLNFVQNMGARLAAR